LVVCSTKYRANSAMCSSPSDSIDGYVNRGRERGVYSPEDAVSRLGSTGPSPSSIPSAFSWSGFWK
jgi:hypothetical protein